MQTTELLHVVCDNGYTLRNVCNVQSESGVIEMNATLTLRQVMGFADYLKRVDADTRPTLAALHFARVDEKHARAYVTDGITAIVLNVDANWGENSGTLSYTREDLNLLVSAAKTNKMGKDYNVSFEVDRVVFIGSDRLLIKPADMTAPDIGVILRDMRKPIERFIGAGKSINFVMTGGLITIMDKMLDTDNPAQFDVRFVGDVAIITHSKERNVFALQMATLPDGKFDTTGDSVDVYEQNVKRILGRE